MHTVSMSEENSPASASSSSSSNSSKTKKHVSSSALDVATILNELTLEQPWTPNETSLEEPLPQDIPPRKPSTTDRYFKRRPSLPLSATHRHSIHTDIPSPIVEQSPGFVEVSLDAWSESNSASEHHSGPAAFGTNPTGSSINENPFSEYTFPSSTFSTRRTSTPPNPWVEISPFSKENIRYRAEDPGPFVNVISNGHDDSLFHSAASLPQNGTSQPPQVKRSLSVGNVNSSESESAANGRQRSTSSNGVFGWLSKSPKVTGPSKTRPTTLPPKDPKEEQKHLREYLQLQQAAQELQKKKEAKHREERNARESHMHNSVNMWETEIIPFWMAKSSFPFASSSSAISSPSLIKNKKPFSISTRIRDLWYQGLPPKCRGTVWCLGIGNELGVTKEMYDLCVIKAKKIAILNGKRELDDPIRDGDGGVMDQGYLDMTQQIGIDIARTFPSLKLFQPGAPYHSRLIGLLETYMCWGHDVGYVEGMSFIAAMLLLNMETMPAFVCFVNLLKRPLHAAVYRMDMDQLDGYFKVFKELFVQQLPMLYVHFQKIGLQPDLYVYDWFLTLFAQTLSLELATKIWDLFVCDGTPFLFRAGVALLASIESRLYGDLEEVLYTLSHVTLVDPPMTETLFIKNLNNIKLDAKEFEELCIRHECLP